MTRYHPVTKEELYQIRTDCKYPGTDCCGKCEHVDDTEGCTFKGANVIIEDVIARVDPLDLLEAWDSYNNAHFGTPHPLFYDMIRLVREKPEYVIAYGKERGWLK